jgi:hypothetical protein
LEFEKRRKFYFLFSSLLFYRRKTTQRAQIKSNKENEAQIPISKLKKNKTSNNINTIKIQTGEIE